jgi:hypothetical protein
VVQTVPAGGIHRCVGRLLAVLIRQDDRLHTVAEVQRLQDVGDVRLHRRLADVEAPADLGVRKAVGDHDGR